MRDSYEQVLVEDQAQWRARLDANHGTSPGIWLVTWKRASGRPLLAYDAIVEEALAYGWVDSRPRSIDDQHSARLLTPRRPASNWSARNKARVEQLTAAGRMHPAGLAAVAAAKATGTWTALDETETLAEPADLAAALDATPGARQNWEAFPGQRGGPSSNGSPAPRPAPPARCASSAPPTTPPAISAPTSGGNPQDIGGRIPVTGGRVTASPLGGKVRHAGGILFLNVTNGKTIKVSRFTIDLSHKDLTGIVNGSPRARVPLFRLDLSHAKLAAGTHVITARGIGLKLTATAAKALNPALGTRLFSAGLKLGTAHTLLRF